MKALCSEERAAHLPVEVDTGAAQAEQDCPPGHHGSGKTRTPKKAQSAGPPSETFLAYSLASGAANGPEDEADFLVSRGLPGR